MRLFFFSLLSARLVRSAIDLQGDQVVESVTEDDPSPISDGETYYPNQADCPVPCSDYSNINGWTTYFSVERLQRCKQPMLLKFSVSQPLNNPLTTRLIRACTLGPATAASSSSVAGVKLTGVIADVDNPKKDGDLFEPSLDLAPACFASGKEVKGNLDVLASGDDGKSITGDVPKLLQGMQAFFDDADNCDEKFVFSYHQKTVAGAYIGAGLGKSTVSSVFKAWAVPQANRTIAQICDEDRQAEQVFGVSIDATGDLVTVQKTLFGWSQGSCSKPEDMNSAPGVSDVKFFDIAQGHANDTVNGNSTTSSSTASASISSARSSSLISSSSRVASSASSGSSTVTSSTKASSTSSLLRLFRRGHAESSLDKRATCRYVKVESGDSCESLAKKCGISGSDFSKYNSKQGFCSSLKPGDYACCSAGDPYTEPKPDPPKANADGTCATHLIADGDTCDALAKKNGITASDIEKWNKGKTWAWTECGKMLLGYNMCLSDGKAPLPPPQQGAECGPIVPGTVAPSGNYSLADLNPCPLKACCSNWGFCGPFSAHCDIHAPPGGGPGTKLPGYEATCVSNCGNEIKQNSGPPAAFNRIGYYESWNMERECLWLKASDANTDGSYTHIHWGFLGIDSNTWKPIIVDKNQQWADFKKLGVKKIASFGGWAYSTEPATYNIIRKAIIDNRETFASNIAQFVKDEGLDGIDIDWEYPGAPDIMVNGQPIGQKTDGVNYLRFLTSLKQKMGDKSVSIAAPASYWYLKAFPIDRIAAVIDYIVYMTYDLHGQWDYGNVNAFDACPSGKCIRSHVNLTETRNSLSIITKAGVPNNKIFVGESSYGRSFHMAVDGCWGPMCEFTGTRIASDANPGRCTKTSGYISNAEINELLTQQGSQSFHDGASNTDIMLYKGDYISYMLPTTKDTRRNDWKGMNFAGSIDWAVDLQAFRSADMNAAPNNGPAGSNGCVAGEDNTVNSADLCAFSCSYDFCPESLCTCTLRGIIKPLPRAVGGTDTIIAWDDLSVDLNRLCKFACKYGYCPDDTCTQPVIDEDEDGIGAIDPSAPVGYDYEAARRENAKHCLIYEDRSLGLGGPEQCLDYCKPQTDAAKEEGRSTNYGCGGNWPIDKPIPWVEYPGRSYRVARGDCICDNMLINVIADTVIEALPAIAQIGCYILMNSLKTLLDIGVGLLTGGTGRVLDAGLDMAATAAQIAAYAYPEEEDPEGAFSWWLSPCGGTDLVPEDIKNAFNIINSVAGGVGSFKPPKNIRKGSGKKGDDANPTDRSKPRGGTGTGRGGTNNGVKKQKKCKIRAGQETLRLGSASNTWRSQSCDQKANPPVTKKTDYVATSLVYPSNNKPTAVMAECPGAATQACHHYSSVIKNNPQWATITCPKEAASTSWRLDGKATDSWSAQHTGAGWTDTKHRSYDLCQRDEYPPAYLMDKSNPAWYNSGNAAAKSPNTGQLVRWLPDTENSKGGSTWKGVCFTPSLSGLSVAGLEKKLKAGRNVKTVVEKGVTKVQVEIDVDVRPEFSFGKWGHAPLPNNGLNDNPCWPKAKTPNDPGFVLLTYDPYYGGNAPPIDYKQPVP